MVPEGNNHVYAINYDYVVYFQVVNNKSANSSNHLPHNHQQLSQHQQLAQTHHRTKSSPDPVSMKKALNAAEGTVLDSYSTILLLFNLHSFSQFECCELVI